MSSGIWLIWLDKVDEGREIFFKTFRPNCLVNLQLLFQFRFFWARKGKIDVHAFVNSG